jgi:hypothetical protein
MVLYFQIFTFLYKSRGHTLCSHSTVFQLFMEPEVPL